MNDTMNQVMLSATAGLVLAPVVEAGYAYVMMNPMIAEVSIDFISSALPATAPATSYAGAAGYLSSLAYDEYNKR